VIIVAPKRGQTMEKFIELASLEFNIEVDYCSDFSELIKERVLPKMN
jgi:hypothetical protein